MKKIMTIIILFFLFLKVEGQEFNDSLYFHFYNYQTITGLLRSKLLDKESLNKKFNVEVLVDSTNTEDFRIYKFYNLLYSEPVISFLIFENDEVEIYDILSFSALINRILDKTTSNEKTKVLWIKEILKILQRYYENANMGNLVVQKNYGKYHYFIHVDGLKNKGIIDK